MEEVSINGKSFPISHILDLYVDGVRWYVSIYGESDQEVHDMQIVDKIIKCAPNLVDRKIKDTREIAANFRKTLDNW